MIESWKSLASVTPSGGTVIIKDDAFWQSAFDEFSLACNVKEPLMATIDILPQEDGVLFRGHLKGVVCLPCNRCTDDTTLTIDHRFDSFEGYPDDPYYVKGKDEEELEEFPGDEAVIRRNPQGHGIDINPSALAWQEFSLVLPVKPVCTLQCKGLCPVCGCNKNKEQCSCDTTQADPRLAPLRGLVVKKK